MSLPRCGVPAAANGYLSTTGVAVYLPTVMIVRLSQTLPGELVVGEESVRAVFSPLLVITGTIRSHLHLFSTFASGNDFGEGKETIMHFFVIAISGYSPDRQNNECHPDFYIADNIDDILDEAKQEFLRRHPGYIGIEVSSYKLSNGDIIHSTDGSLYKLSFEPVE